jgi:hypothetical protein
MPGQPVGTWSSHLRAGRGAGSVLGGVDNDGGSSGDEGTDGLLRHKLEALVTKLHTYKMRMSAIVQAKTRSEEVVNKLRLEVGARPLPPPPRTRAPHAHTHAHVHAQAHVQFILRVPGTHTWDRRRPSCTSVPLYPPPPPHLPVWPSRWHDWSKILRSTSCRPSPALWSTLVSVQALIVQ